MQNGSNTDNRKRVILHIGMLKTGTTSLQAFLRANANALATQGIGFYLPKYINKSMSNAGFLCWESFFEAGGDIPRDPARIKEMEAFAAYAKDYDTLILSEEFLWEKGIEAPGFWDVVRQNLIRMLGDDIEIDLIAFIRRQDEWILSRWKEYVLNTVSTDTMDFPEYLCFMEEAGFMNYQAAPDKIAQTFSKDHMTVCAYDRASNVNFNTIDRFLAIADIPADRLSCRNSKERHPSINLRSAKALSIIHEHSLLSHTTSKRIIEAAYLFSFMYPDDENYYPTSETKRMGFLSRVQDTNARISDVYNGGISFFREDIEPYCVWQDDPEQVKKDAETICRLSTISRETTALLRNTINTYQCKEIRQKRCIL